MRGWVLGALVAGIGLAACSSSENAEFPPEVTALAIQTAAKVKTEALRPAVETVVNGRVSEIPLQSTFNMQAPLTHTNSGEFIAGELRALGYAPTLEKFDSGLPGTNVYVDIPGDSPELVLVSGHHDAWYQSGADDNGTALAVLIEVARSLKDVHLRRSVRVIAFDREEEGLLGSGAYVRAHEGDRIRIVLNMDCVGYASHDPGSQDAPPGFALRDTGDFLAALANGPAHADAVRFVRLAGQFQNGVDVLALLSPGDSSYPGVGAFMRSDHAPFWARGVPGLFITDTANFRNHNYHTPDDTPEKLDYEFLRQSAQLVVAATVAFAESE